MCIFCPEHKIKENICEVQTKTMSNQIMLADKYLENIYVCVACVNDHIAAEGCYHPSYLKTFLRDTDKATDDNMH